MNQMALQSAHLKLANPAEGLKPLGITDLPNDRNDNLWDRIEAKYQLELVEIIALKNAKFPGYC